MKAVGALVILLGVAGVLFFSAPNLRWESVGVAVVGAVLLVIASRGNPR